MRQTSESGKLAKNSTHATPIAPTAFAVTTTDKQITAYRALKAGFSETKDFALKICKVKNYAYLCSAKEPDFGHNKVIRTLFERVPVALLHPQSWFFGENKGTRSLFCIY